jgi:hypothetical protein
MPRNGYDLEELENMDIEDDEPELSSDDSDEFDAGSGGGSAGETPATTTASPAEEVPTWAKSIQENVNILGGMVSQLYGGYTQTTNKQYEQTQTSQPRPDQLPDDHPLVRLEKLERDNATLRGLHVEVHQSFKNREAERFAHAERQLAQEFGGDFDKVVPPEDRQRILQSFLNDADRLDRNSLEMKYAFGKQGWQTQLQTLFTSRHYKELKQREADEVARKREQRERETKNVSRIPSGGSVHQERAAKPKTGTSVRRGYTDAVRQAKEDWEALMGG